MAPTTTTAAAERAGLRARNEPEFARILAALVEAPTAGAGTYTRETARALNRHRLDNAVEEFKAGALVTADVQQLLYLGTPQGVHQLRRRHKVIGLPVGNATWFPAWQFEAGRLRPGLSDILESLARFTTDPIAADRVMRLVRDELHGHSLDEALRDASSSPTAWAVLGAVGS